MEKSIKDYLHLYLGCGCAVTGVSENDNETFKLTGISYDDTQKTWWAYFENTEFGYAKVEDVWLHLRPLPSMTEEELQECGNLVYDFSDDDSGMDLNNHRPDVFLLTTSEQFHWLIQRHFDVFGLIESNLAIDKSTLKP